MPIRDHLSTKQEFKGMFESVNPSGRLESHFGPMDMAVGFQDHRVFTGKRREQELESRILYLEDQLIQMNFNLSLVSNVVDLLSHSSQKGQTPNLTQASKDLPLIKVRPDGLVMKQGPLAFSREMPVYHPYMSSRRAISKSQTELRSTHNSYLKEKRTYSIENLLKSSTTDDLSGNPAKKVTYSSKTLSSHGNGSKHSNPNVGMSCNASCRQCLLDLSKGDNVRFLADRCPKFQPNVRLHERNRLHLDPSENFQRFSQGNAKTPVFVNAKEFHASRPPVLQRETTTVPDLVARPKTKTEILQEKPQQNYFSSIELLSSVAGDVALSAEGYVRTNRHGESPQRQAAPVKVDRLCVPEMTVKHETQDQDSQDEDIDIEHDGFDSPSDSASPKWSDSDEDDGAEESSPSCHSFAPIKEGSNKDVSDSEASYILPDHCSVMEVIKLWEEGSNSIPPIRRWSPLQRAKQKSKISRWRKIMQIFKEKYNRNISEFLKAYSDSKGRVLPVSAILSIHKDDDSVMDEEYENFQIGRERDLSRLETANHPVNPRYVLPRKINGRQVTPLDILKIWERGIGSIPPIKQWTPAQKLKQQSKVSRWKKIVDLYKKDCHGKLSEFRKRFSYDDGKLMPVSAILARCESRRSTTSSPRIEQEN